MLKKELMIEIHRKDRELRALQRKAHTFGTALISAA